MTKGFRPFHKWRITYEDGSTEVKHLPTKTMVYSIQGKMIRFSKMFNNTRPKRIISVEEVVL